LQICLPPSSSQELFSPQQDADAALKTPIKSQDGSVTWTLAQGTVRAAAAAVLEFVIALNEDKLEECKLLKLKGDSDAEPQVWWECYALTTVVVGFFTVSWSFGIEDWAWRESLVLFLMMIVCHLVFRLWRYVPPTILHKLSKVASCRQQIQVMLEMSEAMATPTHQWLSSWQAKSVKPQLKSLTTLQEQHLHLYLILDPTLCKFFISGIKPLHFHLNTHSHRLRHPLGKGFNVTYE
jgi:hypothetical protein